MLSSCVTLPVDGSLVTFPMMWKMGRNGCVARGWHVFGEAETAAAMSTCASILKEQAKRLPDSSVQRGLGSYSGAATQRPFPLSSFVDPGDAILHPKPQVLLF